MNDAHDGVGTTAHVHGVDVDVMICPVFRSEETGGAHIGARAHPFASVPCETMDWPSGHFGNVYAGHWTGGAVCADVVFCAESAAVPAVIAC